MFLRSNTVKMAAGKSTETEHKAYNISRCNIKRWHKPYILVFLYRKQFFNTNEEWTREQQGKDRENSKKMGTTIPSMKNEVRNNIFQTLCNCGEGICGSCVWGYND